MLVSKLGDLLSNKWLAGGLATLVVGQILYLFGFGWLYVPALVFVLAVGLPFPVVLSSLLSRMVVGLVLALSFVQVAAIIQFFVLPESDFAALSLITTTLALLAVFVFGGKSAQTKPLFNNVDAGAALTAAFFAVPFAIFCFWGNDPLRLAAFGGQQSPDGSAHNVAFNEMYGSQHLTYRTNPTYYPKGYHVSSALVMDSLNLHRQQNDWLTNARIFVLQYLVWGSLLAASLYYLSRQLLDKVQTPGKKAPTLLLAAVLGPTISLFYLLPFANQGFINFYYICAAFVCGLLFLEGFKFVTNTDRWLVIGYFMFALGITMSWGPLLLPIVAITPALYLLSTGEKFGEILRQLFTTTKYLAFWAGALLLTAPLYLHFAFADESAFNAHGSIRVFNYALLAVGLAITLYLMFGKQPKYIRDFATNALIPAWLLVGSLVLAQYFLVGEPRYYSIKTAYLLELVLLAVAAALVVVSAANAKLDKIKRLLIVPFAFGMAAFLLISANGNPIEHVRNMLGKVPNFDNDFSKIVDLGVRNELRVSNNVVLHYIPAESKIFGNPLLPNWANGLSPINEGNPESAACNGKIFSIMAYGSGSSEEQAVLLQAIKDCIADRVDKQGKSYYIITDPESEPHLRELFGDKPTFL